MNAPIRSQNHGNYQADKEWILARYRMIRAGVQLIPHIIDELGIRLKNDEITPREAAAELDWIENTPLYYVAHIASPSDMAAQIVRRWEANDANEEHVHRLKPKEYRTPQTTINTFLYWIVRQDEATQTRWLSEHPRDAVYLQKLWEEKCKPQSK